MMKELLQKRLSALFNSWNFHKQELWGNSDIVVIHTQSEKSSNLASTQFYLWLFGEEFHDTTAIFSPFGIYFFSTQKNFTKIRALCAFATMVKKFPVSVQLKPKNDDGFLLIDSTIRNARVIRNQNEKNEIFDDEKDSPFVVGYVKSEYPKTKLFWSCINDLEPKKYKAVTVNSGLNKLFNTDAKKGVKKTSASPKLDQGELSKWMSDVKESALATDEDNFMSMEDLFGSPPPFRGRSDKCWLPKVSDDEQFGCGGNWLDKEEMLKKRNKDGDQLFKFGSSRLDGKVDKPKEERKNGDPLFLSGGNWYSKEDTAKEKSKSGDQLFKFGASGLEGKHEKTMEGNKIGDQLFKFGDNWCSKEDISKEKNKNGDQLFKFGANRVDGKEDKAKKGDKHGDQLFKFGANRLDGKEDKSKESKKDGDQLFKFGGNLPDAKEDKSKEGTQCGEQQFKFGGVKKDNDQMFKFGRNLPGAKEDKSKEGNKDGDQLFKLGEGKTDGDMLTKLGGDRVDPILGKRKEPEHVRLLRERLAAFYSSWRNYKEEQWGKADAIVITTELVVPLETLPHSVSSSFLMWLLDQEFPDTTAVFTETGIEFLCTMESFSSLRTIGIHITMAAKLPVSVQLRRRGDSCLDWSKKTLCQVNTSLKSGPNCCPLVVGCIKGASVSTEALSQSTMFEIAYVDNALTNLLGLGNFEKSETVVAAQQPLLPKCFQKLSLSTCSGAKTAKAVSFSELAKIKSMDDEYYLSHPTSEKEKTLLEKKGDALSPLLAVSSGVNKGLEEKKVFELGNLLSKLEEEGSLLRKLEEAEMLEELNLPRNLEENKMFVVDNFPSKLEENQMFENNLSREFDEKTTLIEKKEGDTDTTSPNIQKIQQHIPRVPSSQAPNSASDPEKSNLLQVKDSGEQSRLTAEGRVEDTVQKAEHVIGLMDDATTEISLPDDPDGSSSRKDCVVSDGEDDEWTLIERESELPEPEVAEKISWKRWFMDKTASSFGRKKIKLMFDDALSKED